MDIDKLIEQLHDFEACAYGYHINGEVLGVACSAFEQVMVDAAEEISKISVLQAENEWLRAELEQVKRERDAAVEFLESAIRYSTNPCEGCKADCIDAGSDAAERVDQCGAFEWRGKKED